MYLSISPFEQFLVVMLLALLPAYVLGKFLPSRNQVSGPLKGLSVQFSGATALYLVILLLGGGVITTMQMQPSRHDQISVTGKVLFEGDDVPSRDHVRLVYQPTKLSRVEGGFRIDDVKLPAQRGADGRREPQFTSIIVEYPGHNPQFIEITADAIDGLGKFEFEDLAMTLALSDDDEDAQTVILEEEDR